MSHRARINRSLSLRGLFCSDSEDLMARSTDSGSSRDSGSMRTLVVNGVRLHSMSTSPMSANTYEKLLAVVVMTWLANITRFMSSQAVRLSVPAGS